MKIVINALLIFSITYVGLRFVQKCFKVEESQFIDDNITVLSIFIVLYYLTNSLL